MKFKRLHFQIHKGYTTALRAASKSWSSRWRTSTCGWPASSLSTRPARPRSSSASRSWRWSEYLWASSHLKLYSPNLKPSITVAALARGDWSVSPKVELAADASIRCSPSGAHVRDPTRLPRTAMLPSRTHCKSPENALEKARNQLPTAPAAVSSYLQPRPENSDKCIKLAGVVWAGR